MLYGEIRDDLVCRQFEFNSVLLFGFVSHFEGLWIWACKPDLLAAWLPVRYDLGRVRSTSESEEFGIRVVASAAKHSKNIHFMVVIKSAASMDSLGTRR